jgi:3-hydroxyacyl-CoA dehydrogenase
VKAERGAVACIGVGNVGRAWAIVFARAGFHVRLYDRDPDAASGALTLIEQNLADFEAASLIGSARDVRGRLEVTASLADAVASAVHVQESVREDIEIKRAVFEAMDAAAPPTATLASSTSALPGSTFMDQLPGRARCLVAHPVNPPSLIPLVEICPTPWTDAATVSAVRELLIEVGQRPILLKKEIPGFLLNRLQYTLVGEALHLIGEGYCEPEDIDAVLTDGLALRWVLMGPLQVAHLNATESFAGFVGQLGDMMRTVGRDARPDYPWDDTLVARIHERLSRSTPVEDIGEQQAIRDRGIMSLLRWRHSLEKATDRS